MRVVCIVALSILLNAPGVMAKTPPRAHSPRPAGLAVRPLAGPVLRALQRFEVRLDLPRYTNPFDPNTILVQGHFLSPSGRPVVVDGFYYQDYTRSLRDGKEVLVARGDPEWRVRFTPTEVGTWAWFVTARDRQGERRSPSRSMRVVPPLREDHGFVRAVGLFFAFTDGTPYFPVGENLAWAGAEGTYSYDLWMRQLGRQGANYIRIWVGPFDLFTLERQPGRYDLAAAWRLDYVMRLAEATGLRVSLCAESFNALRIRPGPAFWKDNPYNISNRGFLRRPADFFIDGRARALFKQRLHYLSARYGCSPSLFSWDLCNEVDLSEDFSVVPVRAWMQEMAKSLRATDPYAHPISTSFGATDGEPAIDALPEIEYVQTHVYGAGDISEAVALQCRGKALRYGKPNLVSEVGASVLRRLNERDDEAIWVHNGLWSPIFADGAGAGSPWWWDSYVDTRGIYDEFGAVARFVRDIPWTAHAWTPTRVVSIRYRSGAPRIARDDLLIAPPQAGWQRAPYNRPLAFEVETDGTVTDLAHLSRLLHGASNAELFNPQTFLVNYPDDGEFLIDMLEPPSSGSLLRVSVDGRVALEQPFAAAEPTSGEGGSNVLQFHVKVAAGQHAIKVENAGSGFMTVYYELPGYRRTARPNIRVTAQGDKQYAIVRVENLDHTWLRRTLGLGIRTVPPTVVVLDGFLIGDYEIELWNTHSGTSIPTRQRCVDGHITLDVPALQSDVAFKVRRM